jgi:DGQHR domain-containing protein
MMNVKSLSFPALKVRQPIGEFYIASIAAKDLVEISYADVRRLASEQRDVERYLGIQRPVNPSRIKAIKQYIEGGDATFPTSVIIAVDQKCAEFDNETNILTLKPFDPSDNNIEDEDNIPYEKIAKVLDGQHRIAGFMDEKDNWCFEYEEKDFDINLSIFIGADISEQANIFATVNLAQTKVNKSLVYDLTDLAKTKSPYKTCHKVAVALDGHEQSPLHKRIKRLGVATPGRNHEPLTQASFVESLVKFISANPAQDRNDLMDGKKLKIASQDELRKLPFRNLFIEDKDLDISEIIYNYFSAIRMKWPTAWEAIDQKGNLLPRSNAFKAFMKFLKEDVYLDIVGRNVGSIPRIDDFYPYFDKVTLSDKDFTTRNFAPGSGGQSTFLKILRNEISLEEILSE